MKILSTERSLRSYLLDQRNTTIQVVSAFAYSTADFVNKLTANGNTVEVIVGTINAFTDPGFIRTLAKDLPSGLWVDFRGSGSTHWKLYLIAPKTVIIGSANLTDMGLDLSRDTCVVIQNQSLFDEYKILISSLKKAGPKVLTPSSRGFPSALNLYEEQHRRSQAAKQKAESMLPNERKLVPTLIEWLNAGNSYLPMFVWSRDLTSSERRVGGAIATKARKSTGNSVVTTPSRRPFKELLVADSVGSKPNFAAGTVLLKVKETGAYAKFVGVDVVQRHSASESDYYVSLPKRGGHPQLFQLTHGITRALKKLLADDDSLREAVGLNRDQLLVLAEADSH